jgi:hypothetical protein
MTKRILLRILIGFAGLLIILLIFLPLIIRKVTIDNSKEWIGRSITWEKFKVNYFTGTAKLIDFKLFEANDTTVFISFDTLIVDTKPYRYFNGEIVVEQLYLKGLTAQVEMYDSGFNFDDLLASSQSDTTEPGQDTTAASMYKMEFSNLELKDAYFTVKDATIDKQMELNNFDFFVPYIALNQADKSEAGVRFDFKNGGYFQSDIDINPTQGDFEANVVLREMDIAGYADFVRKYMDIGDFRGLTNIELNLLGNIHQPEKSKASGSVTLHDFELEDHKQIPLFGIKDLKVKLKEVDVDQSRFVIDSVLLSGPYVYFELYDSTNNIVEYIERAMPPPSDHDSLSAVGAENETADLYYALNALIVDDGTVEIVDKRTGEPFKYNLSALHLETDSISSTSSWVESQSSMLLNQRGELVAQVGINPSNPMDVNIDYTITDFMLSDLNIYSRHYMGFPILYGDMYYKAHTEIADGLITSENKLIIHNVELGNKGGGLYDLPLKFALFLLKDKDGVITLDIPVRGDLKDPEVSVGKMVWNTFKNLIVKAAAAPVKLLSGLIGADPKDIEAIEYDFMDTTFTENRQKQLDLLLQLEQQKPALEIELVYFKDRILEKREIAMEVVGNMYDAKGNRRDHKTQKEEFEQFVFKEAASDTLSIEDACIQIADPAAVDSIAVQLDRMRADQLTNYLKIAGDSSEIFVVFSKPEAPKNLGSKPRFEVKYGMKEEKLLDNDQEQ